VYKEIGYQAPFSEEEKTKAVQKLNNLKEKELNNYTSKKFSKLLYAHKTKNGNFDCIEQLLDLPKVESHHIEKICASLLEDHSMTKEEKLLADRRKNKKPLFSKGIIPKPDIKEWETLHNPSILGVTVTIHGIGYAKIDSSRNFHKWGAFEGIVNPRSQAAFQQQELYSFSSNIVDNFPDADYYVFEEPLPLLPEDPYLKQKVNLIKMRSTIMSLTMMKNHGGSFSVHSIKPSVLDILFSLKDETKNPHDTIANILCSKACDSQFSIRSEIPESALNEYNDHSELITRSLLQSLAFNHLCLEAEA